MGLTQEQSKAFDVLSFSNKEEWLTKSLGRKGWDELSFNERQEYEELFLKQTIEAISLIEESLIKPKAVNKERFPAEVYQTQNENFINLVLNYVVRFKLEDEILSLLFFAQKNRRYVDRVVSVVKQIFNSKKVFEVLKSGKLSVSELAILEKFLSETVAAKEIQSQSSNISGGAVDYALSLPFVNGNQAVCFLLKVFDENAGLAKDILFHLEDLLVLKGQPLKNVSFILFHFIESISPKG
ncbi:MAG: hypothetical protein ACOX2P_03690, partial [Bacillota bacterium]